MSLWSRLRGRIAGKPASSGVGPTSRASSAGRAEPTGRTEPTGRAGDDHVPEDESGEDAGDVAADGGASLEDFFMADHRACDDLWAAVESADDAAAAFRTFDAAMRRHLGWEEDVLFPAVESGGMPAGPTMVMRGEHQQMRALLDQMATSGRDDLLRLGDTLMMLIAQHNAKEEGMLYPMASGVVGPRWPDLRGKLT